MVSKRKGPTEEEFETCTDVLSWLIVWYKENQPDAVEIEILEAAEIEIPNTVEEFLNDDDDDDDDD